jgi:hypothetical protein
MHGKRCRQGVQSSASPRIRRHELPDLPSNLHNLVPAASGPCRLGAARTHPERTDTADNSPSISVPPRPWLDFLSPLPPSSNPEPSKLESDEGGNLNQH